MAKLCDPLWIGVDVSKNALAVCMADDQCTTVENSRSAVRDWLNGLPGKACIAIEATGTYHLWLATQAHANGCQVFLVDGLRLARYRESLGGRAKTDRTDAALLRRFLMREHDELRAWSPPPTECTQLRQLLRRRAKLVKLQGSLHQSLADLPELGEQVDTLFGRIKVVLKALDQKVQALARAADLLQPSSRLREIEGVGPLTSVALANSYHLGNFRSADAFVAYQGLDVRVSESGSHRGRRKLTKKGDPEIRRLLHNAAMAASRRGRWKILYEGYQARGLSKTQALVIIARKLVRVAFSLLQSGDKYCPDRVGDPCLGT